ncbi:hypothetical protein HYV71_04880 [Candidatus Uhrbacteria bacterium]|nr:hypothetical protein [Candidatus Uhrbacteria bacterium]
MKNIIGLKDLRENMERYVSQVHKGQSFVVVKKSKPIFTICPVEAENSWEPVIDFTEIRKGGVKLEDVLARL